MHPTRGGFLFLSHDGGSLTDREKLRTALKLRERDLRRVHLPFSQLQNATPSRDSQMTLLPFTATFQSISSCDHAPDLVIAMEIALGVDDRREHVQGLAQQRIAIRCHRAEKSRHQFHPG
jgi:hypothetical protein